MSVLLWIFLSIVLVFGIVVARGAPYVPSHRRFVRESFRKLYPLSQKDVLVDLGSGDGIVLRQAAELGAHAIGYELNPILIAITKLLSWNSDRITVKAADYWFVKLPQETTIVYIFSVTRDASKLERKMQQWANELGHELWLMTYGATLRDKQPTNVLKAHALYLFTPEPLQ